MISLLVEILFTSRNRALGNRLKFHKNLGNYFSPSLRCVAKHSKTAIENGNLSLKLDVASI